MAHPVHANQGPSTANHNSRYMESDVLTEASQSRGSRKVKGIGSEFSNSSVVPETSLLAPL